MGVGKKRKWDGLVDGELVARADNGSVDGAPSGVQGHRPWWRVRGQSAPEAENVLACRHPKKEQICHILDILDNKLSYRRGTSATLY